MKTKGTYGRNIIRTVKKCGRIFELHATKGWRCYRDPNYDPNAKRKET